MARHQIGNNSTIAPSHNICSHGIVSRESVHYSVVANVICFSYEKLLQLFCMSLSWCNIEYSCEIMRAI